MQPEQKSLYYITGGTEVLLRNSSLLEVYKKKDIEVLLLGDDIDEIFSMIDKYGETDLKDVNKGAGVLPSGLMKSASGSRWAHLAGTF
jgi:molecular chaperone HtpG